MRKEIFLLGESVDFLKLELLESKDRIKEQVLEISRFPISQSQNLDLGSDFCQKCQTTSDKLV